MQRREEKNIDFKLIHVCYCSWIAIQEHFYMDQICVLYKGFLVNSVYLDGVAKRLIEMLCKSCGELSNRKSLESPL